MALTASDVAAANSDLATASYSALSEKLDFLPKLSFSLDTGWATPTVGYRLLPTSTQFAVRTLLAIDLPLFTGGSTVAEIKRANAKTTIAEVNFRAKEREKQLGINSALIEIRDTESAVKTAEVALDAATEARDSAQRMFEHGEATGLELAEAETNHFSAKNLLVNSRLGFEQAKLKLLWTIGKVSEMLGQ